MSAAMEQSHPHAQRPRSKSTTFSFHSDKSRDSPSRPGHERKESNSDKHKTHTDLTTKANPNAAMEEAQPIAAALEKPTLQSLRSFQHNDASGNLIVDPDLSNPTRSRWERPLDTIRSFEAAIDGEYRRRAQSMRADQTDVMSGYGSRRSSYYGGGYEQNRYSQASAHHPNRQSVHNAYDNGYGNGGPVGGPPQRMRYGNRMQSDPGWNKPQNGNNIYPVNGYQQSRDTVITNGSNGSHSDGPYSGEPSSENSSIERGAPVRPPQHDMGEQYGFSGFGREPILEEYGQGPPINNNYGSAPQYPNGAPPPPPPKHATAPVPIKLNSSGPQASESARPKVLSKNSNDDKRRSWFKRRFSKD